MVDSKVGCYKNLRDASHGIAAKVREFRKQGHENGVSHLNFYEEVTTSLRFRRASMVTASSYMLQMSESDSTGAKPTMAPAI